MHTCIKASLLASLTVVFICAGPVCGEEGGSGHYMPGSMASFIDSVPPSPAFLMRLNVMSYEGSASANLTLPIAGTLSSDVDASIMAYGLTMVWRPDLAFLSDDWSYSMSATIPLVTAKISASEAILVRPGQSVDLDDDETGLGDILVQPIMVSRKFSPDFKINSRLTIYVPTGDYTVGKLANTGKNFWTFSPSLECMYFGVKNGIEGSLFIGVDFNTENQDTDYTSGTQVHLDGTLAQHVPLWGGLAEAGINAYYYKQIEGDSGEGAQFGDFKAMTTGLGPALSYSRKVGSKSITSELKWLHEFETEKRLAGDIIFFKLLVNF